MALFGQFGSVVNTGLSILGLQGGAVGAAGQLGSAFVSSLTQPTANFPVASGPIPQPVSAGGEMIRGMGRVAMRAVIPILIKIAEKLGRRTMSLREAVRIIRGMGKWLLPNAIAVSLGLTMAELAMVIQASSAQKTRRMNPANVSALRRSMRRLESFHRLCLRADSLRGRRRGRSGAPRAGRGCPPGVQVVRA